MPSERVNLFSAELQHDEDDPEGYVAGYLRFGDSIGARRLGGTIYELGPGQSNCPYHYEYGNEEWLIVLDGTLTVRRPDGDETFEPGDVVCFVEGPDGAHKLTNRGEGTVRLLMLSTKRDPSVAVYPDSDKIGAWSGDDRDKLMVKRDSNVDYWTDELPGNEIKDAAP
jgi:uncharacterized cupin superfamily protein